MMGTLGCGLLGKNSETQASLLKRKLTLIGYLALIITRWLMLTLQIHLLLAVLRRTTIFLLIFFIIILELITISSGILFKERLLEYLKNRKKMKKRPLICQSSRILNVVLRISHTNVSTTWIKMKFVLFIDKVKHLLYLD